MSRQFFVGGNWKLNGSRSSITKLVSELNAGTIPASVEVVVAPPTLYLDFTASLVSSNIALAAQNAHQSASGAFTGETSADMLADSNIPWLILGHSERRHVFGETDITMTEKVSHAQAVGLGVIACIGEKLDERESGHTNDVCFAQLEAFASGISDWSRVVIAYEPVWAIGTGKTATPEMAQGVHAAIREWLASNVSPSVAAATRVIYGGSVKPGNCVALSQQADIDGFLVGGASLQAESFLAIINNSKST